MHNGGISEFPKVVSSSYIDAPIRNLTERVHFRKRLEILKETSPEYAAMIYGNTDTEHLAALYFTYLGDIHKQYSAREMRNAMARAVLRVQAIQVCVLGQNTPNSLNLCTCMP